MRFLILLAIIGAAMAVPRHQERIAGGETTTVEQFPFMANMQYGWFGTWWLHSCGGTLISTGTVLTSALCFMDDPASSWRVLLGTSFANSGGTSFQVSSIIPHEKFNSVTMQFNIAIARLSSLAVISDSIGLARIAGPNYILPDGTPFTVVGWGDVNYGGSPSNVLQHAVVSQINQNDCAERYTYLKTQHGYEHWPDVTEGMICAGIDAGGKDACEGDYGGPLLHDSDIVVGITSWGYRCAEPGFPGVNTRVGYLAEWIVANA